MKKAVVLGMILLALGTLAYADASIGFGWGRTQFNIAQGSDISNSDITSGWVGPAPSDWPPGMRENLDIVWSGDHTAFKITGYLQNALINWVNIQGTLKLMPDMFSVMIGRFDGDGFDAFRKTSPHPIRDENNGNVGRFNGWGVIFDVAPKDSGLEAAVMVKTGDPTAGADGFGTATDPAGSTATIEETLTNTNVGFAYTVPNTVKIVAGSTTAVVYHASRNIFGRVELLMVPNLTAWADVKYSGFDLATKVSNIDGEVAGAYDMKPMTIVLAAKFGSDDKVTSFKVIPEVYYNMGVVTLGLYANVGASDAKHISDTMFYAIEPYVKLNDFNTRISFMYSHDSVLDVSYWQIPVLIDWGF
jgi:hypothetical protein